jgi:ribonuclease HI
MSFKKMHHLHLFTDGSVNTQFKVGYGAYLLIADVSVSIDSLKDTVKVQRFEDTSSTKLELQTLLWALGEAMTLAKAGDITLTAYTDCQNIISLPSRRARLEGQNFYASNNKRLNHFELYQEFYRLTATIKCDFVKVVGHQADHKKDDIDRLYTMVDRASRRALRESKVLPVSSPA